jgi:hypothetical protein
VTIRTPFSTSGVSGPDPPEQPDGTNHQQSTQESSQTIAIEAVDAAPRDPPAFLRRSFGSKVQGPNGKSSKLSKPFAVTATKMRSVFDHWRRAFAQDTSIPKAEHRVVGIAGAAFAILILVVIVAGVGAAIAVGQIKSLKSDVAMLQRELLPLRVRLGKLEQAEKAKRDSGRQEEAQDEAYSEKNKAGGETRTDQAALNLSREEAQVIREYIKPAASSGTAAPAINVGDPIAGATIPLPSPITEKVPRLSGAKFTVRNGAIIILRRDSRQADAVLPPS